MIFFNLFLHPFSTYTLSKMTSAKRAPSIKLNDGNEMPIFGLGTGRGTAKEHESIDDVRQAVFWAIEAGYRHIDTASFYKDELQVGQGIADAIAKGLVTREEVFVTTKLYNDKHRQEEVVPALRDSLKLLNLDYVDLYLIHFPLSIKNNVPDDTDYLETWRGMEEAKKLGLAKSIGVSNFNRRQLGRLIDNSSIKPAVIQIEVSPTLTQESLVSCCQKLGVAVVAYSPFGFLVTRKITSPSNICMDEPILGNIANKYRKTSSQVVLRYLIDRGLAVVPKSTNKDRIVQNIDIFDFNLTEDEVLAVNKLNTGARIIGIPGWKDYPNYPFGEE